MQHKLKPAVTKEAILAGAGIEWLHGMSDTKKWDLTAEEIADLLGGISVRSYHDHKRKALAEQPVNLSRDTLDRLSLLLGISKALQLIVPNGRDDLAYEWFKTPNNNPVFENQSIKKFLLERKSIEALYVVRRYLDAARG